MATSSGTETASRPSSTNQALLILIILLLEETGMCVLAVLAAYLPCSLPALRVERVIVYWEEELLPSLQRGEKQTK